MKRLVNIQSQIMLNVATKSCCLEYILKRWLQTVKSSIVLNSEGKEVAKDANNYIVSQNDMLIIKNKKKATLIDHAMMSREGSQLLSKNESLNTRLSSFVVGNCWQKRKQSEVGGEFLKGGGGRYIAS